ncbi:alkaline phosphatase D family protein [Algiphilus sp.]|uniref:alkaline phosphatase D family protein n=1 Tax=Algiphilus sp. TaxID=1872431 RepID=UPI003C401472
MTGAETDPPSRMGPVLFFRGYTGGGIALAVLAATPCGTPAPQLETRDGTVTAEPLAAAVDRQLWRYRFTLPATRDAAYRFDGEAFAVSACLDHDLRIAFVSCNGREHGDAERDPRERNVLWRHLADANDARPVQLLLNGGDQLYADEMLDVHPLVREWRDDGDIAEPDADTMAVITERLRAALFTRYLALYAQDGPARVTARVPSLCIWDDHDICDGWGSLYPHQLDAAIGRAVFGVAREAYLLFQHACAPDEVPPLCPDRSGISLSWCARLPDLAVMAPDLRSERRPDRVMGPAGHAVLADAAAASDEARVLVLSSVPVLGPRLSWVEGAMRLIPHAQKYEDDLRDQWQSRAHRDEWRHFLRTMLTMHERPRTRVTLLSGEIHLATRGAMYGARDAMHQLVASGIAHPPPPRAYARGLGLLAMLGESPLPVRPVRLHPLPGQRTVYTAQRNYLMLERRHNRWRAWWELERDGPTPALAL